jgi:two-component system chemotaxis sensor kinase CheA
VTQFSDERGAEMRELFFETAQELLQSLNDEALKLEKHPADVEAVRSIRRIVHTLKGDAAACSYGELSELAHELEDALALETLPSPATLAEVTFSAADTLGTMLACYRRKVKLPPAEPLRKMIHALGQPPKIRKPNKKQVSEAPQARAMWTEYEKLAMQNALAKSKGIYHITALVDPHCAMPIAARQLLLNAMGGVGEVLGTRPQNDSLKSGKQLELLVASDQPAGQVTAKCRVPSV